MRCAAIDICVPLLHAQDVMKALSLFAMLFLTITSYKQLHVTPLLTASHGSCLTLSQMVSKLYMPRCGRAGL